MPPRGLAILLGAGPTTGSGIARILASPQHGNYAVALLSRSASPDLASALAKSSGGGILHPFATDTTPSSLSAAFDKIKAHDAFKGLPLSVAVWNVKHSHKTVFEEESAERFGESLQVYVTGAMAFAQLVTAWMLSQAAATIDMEAEREGVMSKKGTLIFTGTLGALRTNAGFAAYGAGRSGVRMLAQSLAREYSARGVHVVHAIANGGIVDDEGDERIAEGKRMRAESVGRLYLQLSEQGCDLWIHECDMRPSAENF